MFGYYGAKCRQSKWIDTFIPKDNNLYIEPFSGAFWVYFKMQHYPDQAVYNDFNPHMSNIFRCVSQDVRMFRELMEEIEPNNKEIFLKCREDIFGKDASALVIPNFGVALKYLYLVCHVWSGINPVSGSFVSRPSNQNKWSPLKKKLYDRKSWVPKINGITNVHNDDFQKVIEQYDDGGAFFFVDPPYAGYESDGKNSKIAYSLNGFSKKDHERLANTLKNIKGKFALTYYDFPELSKLYPKNEFKWEQKNYKVTAGSGHMKGKKLRESTEILIMNY